MRNEQEMLSLITTIAEQDDRIRAVIMNGSRVNPAAKRDIFQDFDIVYFVTEIASFTADHTWINQFGEIMIVQMPEAMADPPPMNDGHFAYLFRQVAIPLAERYGFPYPHGDDQRVSAHLRHSRALPKTATAMD